MADKWYFTKEELINSPSARAGISPMQELDYRRQTALLINHMGQRLQVSQSCINTATIYMHRFYACQPQTKFKKCSVACVTIFLAAKIKNTSRSLEHVVKTMYLCLSKDSSKVDVSSDDFKEKTKELVFNEFLLLKTLDFVIDVKYPHGYVKEFCLKTNTTKEFLCRADKVATHCLQLTSMCLRYKPRVIASFCIYLTAKWSQWKIQKNVDGQPWFKHLDPKVTEELLWKLEKEFKDTLDSYSLRSKNRVMDLFNKHSVPCKMDDNKSSKSLVEDKESKQRTKISFDEYIARKKNQKLNTDDNHNKTSTILNISVKLVPISAKVPTAAPKIPGVKFETSSNVNRDSRKRKSNIYLSNIIPPAKKINTSSK